MRRFFNWVMAAIIVYALFVLLVSVLLGAPRNSTTPSVLAYAVAPEQAATVSLAQTAAQTEALRIAAERAERRDWLLFGGALTLAGMGVLVLIAWLLTRRPVVVQHQLPANTPPHLIDAQWRVIDAQMLGSGYELEDGRRGK